jgi:hypothetical protein
MAVAYFSVLSRFLPEILSTTTFQKNPQLGRVSELAGLLLIIDGLLLFRLTRIRISKGYFFNVS